VALAKQLLSNAAGADVQDIYLRNGGVNEMAPLTTVGWHRDSVGQWHDGEATWDEFMHYPFADGTGVDESRGCLRLVPGSHLWTREEDAAFTADLEQRRVVRPQRDVYLGILQV
jgi:ectoine hydroxylase-related dioxygenase (phytanoyl-CoA dioxygenase family)